MSISVIIPSYRNPRCLDLCLKSLFEGQEGDNEILVVLDGFADESAEVLSKYPKTHVLPLDQNYGQQLAVNSGVAQSSGEYILLINDDNVAPKNWDGKLNLGKKAISELFSLVPSWMNVVIPNQIEPYTSIFSQFDIRDFGRTPETFDYEAFIKYEDELSRMHVPICDSSGQTYPIFISKKLWMVVGGLDMSYPNASVTDWDLFVRLQLLECPLIRYYSAHFYHFVSIATKKTPEQEQISAQKEAQSFDYFHFKWGYYPRVNYDRNLSRFPIEKTIRGVEYP